MRFDSQHRRSVATFLLVITLVGCGQPAPPATGYAPSSDTSAGLVAPLSNDTGDDIVSWVDGQVGHRLAGRDRQARSRDRRLSGRRRSRPRRRSTASAAARTRSWRGTGSATTRSASTACRSCCSRRFSTSIPNRPEPDAARDRAHLEARGDRAAGAGPAHGVDARSHRRRARSRPTTPTAWRARRRAPAPLPYGFAFENPRTFEPLSPRETQPSTTRRLLARRVFQNTSLLVAKLQTADNEDNWEKRPAGLRQPRLDGSRVLLVRGLPRRPRRGRRAR